MKRVLPVILALVLVLSSFAFSYAAENTGFADVSDDAWYADAVAYCRERGWMSDTSETIFSPNGTMTRSMLATVLYRQAGSPTVTGTDSFTDTEPDIWYSNAVVWASGEGIINGYGNGLFAGLSLGIGGLIELIAHMRGSVLFPNRSAGPKLGRYFLLGSVINRIR